MEFLKQFIAATIATFCFGKYFDFRLKVPLIATGISGGLSWLIYQLVVHYYNSKIIGALLGSIALGLIGEFLARKLKLPATIFIIAGIIPLVPGAGMYYTMLHFVTGDIHQFSQVGIETIFIAGAIALGILASSIFSKPIKRIRKHTI